MPQPSFLPSKLEARTIGLVHLGVNAHAWKEDDAYEVVRQCRELLVPILGGDVLKLDSVTKEIKYAYDNWYVEGGALDSSWDYAQDRITFYSDVLTIKYPKLTPIFVLVFGKRTIVD
jgi:hypothetical protein